MYLSGTYDPHRTFMCRDHQLSTCCWSVVLVWHLVLKEKILNPHSGSKMHSEYASDQSENKVNTWTVEYSNFFYWKMPFRYFLIMKWKNGICVVERTAVWKMQKICWFLSMQWCHLWHVSKTYFLLTCIHENERAFTSILRW